MMRRMLNAGMVSSAVVACSSNTPSQPVPHTGATPQGSDHADHHQHDFSDVEAYVQRFDSPERAAWQRPEEVVRLLDVQAHHAVVDLGAGTGYFLPYLAPTIAADGSLLALDTEARMVQYMTRRIATAGWAGTTARVVSPNDPGLPSRSVDRLLIVNTWHHLPERAQYATKLWRALKADGALLIVDFTVDSPIGPPAEFRLSADQVIAELGQRFVARAVEEELPYQYAVLARPVVQSDAP